MSAGERTATVGPGDPTAWAEWRRHWPLLVAATMGMSLSSVHLYSLGALLDPISADTGWSRTQITAGQTLSSSLSFVFAPICGVMMDKWGARRIALPGMLVFLLGVIGFSTVRDSLVHWYLMWVMLSVGLLGLKPNVWCGSVTGAFRKSRALAFALVLSGTSLGTAFVPFLAVTLADRYGWRGAYVGLGGLWLAIVFPFCFAFLRPVAQKVGNVVQQGAGSAGLPGLTVREGLRSGAFVRLCIAGFLFSISLTAMTMHFVPLLSDHGIDRKAAAGIAGLIGVTSVLGRLVAGALLDRLPARAVGGVALLLPILPVTLLLVTDFGVVGATALAVLIGLSLGSELDLLAFMATRHFGMRNYGTLFGFVISVLAAGTAMGPIVASWIRDVTASYDLMLWTTLPAFVVSALAIASMPREPGFEAEPAATLPT